MSSEGEMTSNFPKRNSFKGQNSWHFRRRRRGPTFACSGKKEKKKKNVQLQGVGGVRGRLCKSRDRLEEEEEEEDRQLGGEGFPGKKGGKTFLPFGRTFEEERRKVASEEWPECKHESPTGLQRDCEVMGRECEEA